MASQSQSSTSLLGTPVGDITLIGYILPPPERIRGGAAAGGGEEEDYGSEEEEEEEEESQPEFLDMSEMQGGGHRLRSSLPSRGEVAFQDMVSGSRHQVEGRFALRSPWWEVTCVARRRGKKHVVQGYPSYRLRADLDGCGWRPLLSLFLKACNVEPPELLAQFFAWLPADRDVTLLNLAEALHDFERGGNVGAAQCIRASFTKSDAGMQVHAASLYPLVMTYLPTLLPGHFLELLKKGKERVARSSFHPPTTTSTQATPGPPGATVQNGGTQQEMEEAEDLEEDPSLLNQLEQMLTTDVWKLGFNYVMYKELKLTRCEAPLQAFIDCDLLDGIPPLQRTALWAYDRLKKHCYRTGSTYMDQQLLCDRLRGDAGTPDWATWDAVEFLRTLGVVVFDRQKKVGLHNLFSYETGISTCLRSLLQGEQWRIPLDAREVLHTAAVERRRAKMEAAMDAEEEEEEHRGTAAVAEHRHHDHGEMEGGEPVSDPVLPPQHENMVQSGLVPPPQQQNMVTSGPVLPPQQENMVTSGPVLPPRDENMVTSEPSGVPSGDGEEEADPERLLPPIELDEDQVRAVEMICANPVTVISGKGGCGKTTVVSLLFKAAIAQRSTSDAAEIQSACAAFENDTGGSQGWDDLDDEEEAPPLSPGLLLPRLDGEPQRGEEEGEGEKAAVVHGADEVLLTAPTGRAASLLTKKTCFTAYTLHQVLWSFMMSQKDENNCPSEWKFRGVRVLVVDEGSLVCVQLLHSVLSMLTKHAQLRKFVILGDIRQLPSIQPGNTLCDLFHSLKVRSWAIEMKTNHRAESQLIVSNATLIADMGMKKCSYRNLEFDAVVDLNGPRKMAAADKKFIHIRLPREESDDDVQNAIKLLIGSAPGLKDDSTSQFIAFRRVDVALINELCCKHYNNHTTNARLIPGRNHKYKLSFQPGDKVCCTKNGYINNTEGVKASVTSSQGGESTGGVEASVTSSQGGETTGDPENKTRQEQDKLRLCNGEIFFIREDVTIEEDGKRRIRYLTLDDGDGRMIKVDFKELQRECRLQHAWARTIHTFQGSENETIVYVMGNSQAQTWKHVYTAVTRGQKRVYVVARQDAIAAAITKRETPRTTRLSGLVKKVLDESSRAAGSGENVAGSQPGTPAAPGRPPGLLRSPTPASTPPSSWNPGRSRDPCVGVHSMTSTPTARKSLWKKQQQQPEEVKVEVPDQTSVLDEDMVFSQAYSWSPMNSEEERFGSLQGACSAVADDQPLGLLRTGFGSQETAGKRLHSDRLMGTPPKQIKTEPETENASPLGCSTLSQLSLHTPKSSRSRRLYKDEPPC